MRKRSLIDQWYVVKGDAGYIENVSGSEENPYIGWTHKRSLAFPFAKDRARAVVEFWGNESRERLRIRAVKVTVYSVRKAAKS